MKTRLIFLLILLLCSDSLYSGTNNYRPANLKVSANQRYLVDQNNRPFQIIGDSAHSLFVNLPPADLELYFANRQAHGFNCVNAWVLCTNSENGHADGSTYDGILPLLDANLVTLQGNINSLNPRYLKRMDAIVNAANRHGIILCLNSYDTAALDGFGANSGDPACFAYGQALGNHFKRFPNIIWHTGNDFQDWQTNSRVNGAEAQIMAGITSTDPRPHTTQLNFFVSGSHDDQTLVPFTSFGGAYTLFATYAEVLKEYNALPTMPTFMIEANYEGGDNTGQDFGDPPTLRRQNYWTMTSGAIGQFWGNLYVHKFLDGWKDNLDTVCTTQFIWCAQLFSSFKWWNLVPDQDHHIVTAGYGVPDPNAYPINDNYVTTTAVPNGTLAVSYVPNRQTITVNLASFRAPVTLRWFDPTNNTFSTVAGSPFANSGSLDVSPGANNSEGTTDWVLVMTVP